MKIFKSFIIIVIVITACQFKKKSYIISPDKMVELLVQIHIADGVSFVSPDLQSSAVYDSMVYSTFVFDKFGISREQFDSSMAYYSRKPTQLEKIYDKVVSKLSLMEVELTKEEQEEQRRLDSLIKIKVEREQDSIKALVKDSLRLDSLKL